MLHSRHAFFVDGHGERATRNAAHLDGDRPRPEPDDDQGNQQPEAEPREATPPCGRPVLLGDRGGEGSLVHGKKSRTLIERFEGAHQINISELAGRKPCGQCGRTGDDQNRKRVIIGGQHEW